MEPRSLLVLAIRPRYVSMLMSTYVSLTPDDLQMGRIIALDQAPRCKFVFPKNGDESLVENEPFTVQMKILSMETGKPDVATEPHRSLNVFR